MGRAPCCEKVGLKRGRWTAEEDEILRMYIQANGEGSWRSLPKNAGLLRCGKSCRLRWINYLRADLKRGNITPEEEDIIVKLHRSSGNRWSLIAAQLPGRTDNEIKNYWNSNLSRRIHRFRKPSNESLSVDLAEMGGGCKRKGGRTSPSASKKNVKNGNSKSKNLRPDEAGDQKESLVEPGPCQEDNGGGILYPYEDIGGALCPTVERESENLILCSKKDGETGTVGPHEGLRTEMLCFDDKILVDEVLEVDGLLGFGENTENGVLGINERGSEVFGWNIGATSEELERERGVLSSNAEGGEWYSSSSSSSLISCFDEEWGADWDWNGDVEGYNGWEEGEQILSWLWAEDNGGGESITVGRETAEECEQQKALAAWLLF